MAEMKSQKMTKSWKSVFLAVSGLDIQDLTFTLSEMCLQKISAKIIFGRFLSSLKSLLEKILNKYAILLAK